ncbi:site-specific integrase [Vibrio gangliei]|uniref:site-specific integrase n=1 Tax=Vibrio gangliei TaxID=2077090 RepID=UPI000D018F7B|nr:site-specific integrase [Vibrio gangliei]
MAVKASSSVKKRKIKRIDAVVNEFDNGSVISKKKKSKVPSIPPKSVKELNAIFDEVYKQNETLYQIFHMAALTGLRFSDASWLTVEDFYDNEVGKFVDSFSLSQQKTCNMAITRLTKKRLKEKGVDQLSEAEIKAIESRAKKGSMVTIFVNDEMREIVQNVMDKRKITAGLLFPNKHHFSENLPISTNGANNILKKVKLKLGLNYPLSTHSFRKFFANAVMRGGCTPEKVRDLLGQKSLDATTLYVSSEEEELRSAVGQLSYNQ